MLNAERSLLLVFSVLVTIMIDIEHVKETGKRSLSANDIDFLMGILNENELQTMLVNKKGHREGAVLAPLLVPMIRKMAAHAAIEHCS